MLENDNSVIAIGKRLSFLRKLARLQRGELATLADVNKSSISLWEHGKNPSGISPKSLRKVLAALKTEGVEATELWVKEGIGEIPKKATSNFLESLNHTKNEILTKQTSLLGLTENFTSEVNIFTSLSGAATIAKIDHNGFQPFFEKGDFVGGIWQHSSLLHENRMCIIKINQQLKVVYIMLKNTIGIFDIYFSYPFNKEKAGFVVEDLNLENVAPVIRLWR